MSNAITLYCATPPYGKVDVSGYSWRNMSNSMTYFVLHRRMAKWMARSLLDQQAKPIFALYHWEIIISQDLINHAHENVDLTRIKGNYCYYTIIIRQVHM